jgi:formylglycine-generating enzyme required for sulfatase activity
LSGSGDNTLKLWRLDWKYELPEWADWDDGAEPYLHNFLTVRNGKWNDDDFKLLINNLQNRGYGWLKPDGVKRELEKMTAVWQDSIPELSQKQPFIEPEIGMQFVYVEPGSFQMGLKDATAKSSTAGPPHPVTISNGYWMGKYEVTQDEYQSIIGSNPSCFKGGRKPVEQVRWDDAVNFCQKLTELERAAGRLPSEYEYRLPTEAEWEYAARGGNMSKGYQYSGSDNLDSVAWYGENSGNTTHDVGTKLPNELGIYDMTGNVDELCQDDWHDNYNGAPSDGSRWGDGTGSRRMDRGGNWCCKANTGYLHVAHRGGPSQGTMSAGTGIRVAVGPIDNIKASQVAVTESAAKPLQKVSEQTLQHDQPWTVPNLNMQFVYVKPGSFQMGSNENDSEKPVHQVTISNGYWLGKYEVTQDEYQSIIGSNPSNFKGGRKPVDSVSWNDAVSFCQKLTELERTAGRLLSGYEYRLPTEAEWEFAARGGTASKGYQYSGSDNPDSVAWYDSNSGATTHDVGTKSPNELGIYDMSGNVWEWCQDDWHSDYKGAPSDGNRWGDGTGSYRVCRGGSWDGGASNCGVAIRSSSSPGHRGSNLGLRVAVGPIDNIKTSQVAVTESAAKPIQKVSEQTLQHDQPWTVPNLNMQFVYVKPGSFQMGSNEFASEKPVHSVTLSNGYWLGKYEVTQDEYQSIIGSNPSNFKGGRKPVEQVSWDDAVSFCQKLTERERSAGRLPSGYEYRLPTEAEWEFAARGGNMSKGYQYSGSDNIDSVAWYGENSGKTPHDVGTKSPNELGIYDMSGNVLEWCLDDWHSDYKGAPSDGDRWGDGSGSYRVHRGGDWLSNADRCRVADRSYGSPGSRRDFIGFRVALASSSR